MPQKEAIYRFGPYELRTRTREVYKNGMRLKLRPQPFLVLQALVERSGDVVTREELHQCLWPAETFVDFEHGLNTAIKELRGLLNDSAGEPRFIQTLPKLGYRILAPVESALPAPLKEIAAGASPGLHTEKPQSATATDTPKAPIQQHRVIWQTWRRAVAAAAAVVVIVGGAVFAQWPRLRTRTQAPTPRAMLAVLPFENLTGDATQDYFSDGLTEEMIGQLGRLDPQRLGVIARASVMHYKRTQEALTQIGRELGVQYVLEGSVRRESNNVRISAQLIQMKDQTHLWSRQYDRELKDLLSLQGEIAQEIADEIRPSLGDDRSWIVPARTPAASPSSYEAYDLYLKGLYFWNKRTDEDFRQAAAYFQQSITKDPNYARAYAGLANTFGLISTWSWDRQDEFMPRARTAALRALQIDESLSEAHTSLALIAESYDYDWQAAEKEFQRAIQLDPGYATAHQWYAEYLSWQGRFDEALAQSERARQLDPLSLIIAADDAAILNYSRQYDRAIARCRGVLDMDPDFPRARGVFFGTLVHAGRFAEALNEVEQWIRPRSAEWAWQARAIVYGEMGRKADAEHALAELEQLTHSKWDLTPGTIYAYVAAGRKDQAIALLQKAYSQHSSLLTLLKVEPSYDPLRSDPRFQDLLRRVGFPLNAAGIIAH